ncbi:juvenile hormone esterase-like isoform X1 [Leptidea sinapis]|uniref:juvenile hormone esterase-like isoform X1 n=2 Tax=Leptidea sinapis TaxID=189913 RepID=UPI0021C4B306|nr:juvenile hormone esterase-like isoform X1 [Leptidea sinapis]
MVRIMLIKLIICILNIAFVVSDRPIVKTTHGYVAGVELKTLYEGLKYYGFMGIPFAAPPIKELRFKDPIEIDPWQETLEATKEKPACVQHNTNIKKGQPIGQYGVEDCLYLDIFTPNIDEVHRPVIIFIYNEMFQVGYNKTKDYAPDFFIEENVIVVTLSHRLSVFGFLSFDDDVLPGNAGLKDIYIAIKWIKNNIERFGGDPDRLTLMGSQGGAVSIDLLIHSEANKLFNSAILQSGSSLSQLYLERNVRERALKLGELLKIPSTTSEKLLKELQDVSPNEILKEELRAMPNHYNVENQRGLLPFGPVVERDGLINQLPEDSLQDVNIPIMIGYNSREGLDASIQYLLEPNFIGSINRNFPLIMPRRLRFKFDPESDSYIEAVEEVKKFYFKKAITIKSVPQYVTYIGDILSSYNINMMAEMYSNKTNVYFYYFDYYSDLNENKNNLLKLSVVDDGTWGAATADELCYLFKCPHLMSKYLRYRESMSEEAKIQRSLVKLWTNFAKYGNPTPDKANPLSIKWPTYSNELKQYLHISNKMEVKQNLLQKEIQFWNKFIEKWGRRAVNGVVKDNYIKDEL